MLSAFKAKLRTAREGSRVRADSAAEMEDLRGSDVEEEGSGWYVGMYVSADLVILNSRVTPDHSDMLWQEFVP